MPLSAPQTSGKQNGTSTTTNLLDFDLFSSDLPASNNKPTNSINTLSPTSTSKPLSPMGHAASQQSPPQTNKPDLNKQFSNLNIDDIWGKHGSLVSLDNLGQKEQPKRSNGPSMNTLASTNAPIWNSTTKGNQKFTPLNKDDLDSLILSSKCRPPSPPLPPPNLLIISKIPKCLIVGDFREV
ncbi:hypothetical protein K493DRAFT_39999 [Basidiobolus meristosporus CBS 931.73]|uniref:Uncharacterized protein n=1 Tax=Basidiobolus meristosporus CBS 931.73 TaxID=1314790 RepID=A0A1Y1Y4Q4_9FUNG|nr:hypothetical protein K493DRAFT_39999 [Basidiobolus meristosporus CBS 931.73]|eukprot:ORX92885.1 hypothetical protein K493DRAFT_39999 [Basidiobolus meristosporus CBS 931.73]